MNRTLPSLSLMFFASAEGDAPVGYEYMMNATEIADQGEFEAVWMPERHFNTFGGLYPSPSVLAAALAVKTKRIRLRAGSVVLPLAEPLRITEEWSVIDNLSGGRVDLAFAQGWNPADFALIPEHYPQRLEKTYLGIEMVRRLWRGEAVPRVDGNGNAIQIQTYPRPLQCELNVWLTCSMGGPDRFYDAGMKGYNILTGLLFQSPEELANNLSIYRNARAKAGLDPHSGRVTLMLHCFLGDTEKEAMAAVREPLTNYLRESFGLWRARFEHLNELQDHQREMLWEFAFHRYFQSSGLFGSPTRALETLKTLKSAGVDEVACLTDFGVPYPAALESLRRVVALNQQIERQQGAALCSWGQSQPAHVSTEN